MRYLSQEGPFRIIRLTAISLLLPVAGLIGCSRGEPAAPVSESAAEAALYVKCTSCGESRKVSMEELGKLFPPAGLELRTTPATCAKCQTATLERAIRCPKDGTVYTLKQAREVTLEPCPICGWTQAEALRQESTRR